VLPWFDFSRFQEVFYGKGLGAFANRPRAAQSRQAPNRAMQERTIQRVQDWGITYLAK
jgi:hypothetical protein